MQMKIAKFVKNPFHLISIFNNIINLFFHRINAPSVAENFIKITNFL